MFERDDNPVRTHSVRDLVNQRQGEVEDRWMLSLVQRDLAWDARRMRGLLDSLLEGYPIGMLLLCRVASGSRAISQRERPGDAGRPVEADGRPELVDGQQRVFALSSLFTPFGHGRFFLSMTADRESAGVSGKRGAAERTLRHIEWFDSGTTDLDRFEESPQRGNFVDLSRWLEFTRSLDSVAKFEDWFADLPRALNKLDPKFNPALLYGEALAVATERTSSLIWAWIVPLVPVVTARVKSPTDVLELFTRVNRGGVVPASNDLYFAAIKTVWHGEQGAEITLKNVVDSSAPSRVIDPGWQALDRWTALSLISRLASRGLGLGDPLPLNVDRLGGEDGYALVAATETVAELATVRIRRLVDLIVGRESSLQEGRLWLRFVSRFAWEDVFAWAITHPDASEGEIWYEESAEAVDAYLLGTTMFRYPQVLGDKFRRAAFLTCINAGAAGESFPLEALVGGARWDNPDLKGGRLAPVRSAQELDGIARDATTLLVSRLQGLPIASKRLELDHIIAEANRDKMRDGRSLHAVRRHLSGPANFWWLDGSINEALGRTLPHTDAWGDGSDRKKFQELRNRFTGRVPEWRDSFWMMAEGEKSAFESVGDAIADGDLDRAELIWATLAGQRTTRLVESALDAYEGVRWFAKHEEGDPSAPMVVEPPATPSGLVTVALGLTEVRRTLEEKHALTKRREAAARASTVFDLGPMWGDLETRIYDIWNRATRRLAEQGGEHRTPQRQSPSGDTTFRWIRAYRLPEQRESTFVTVRIEAASARGGLSPICWSLDPSTPDYLGARERLLNTSYEECVPADHSAICAPVRVDPALSDDENVRLIVEAVSGICGVIRPSLLEVGG